MGKFSEDGEILRRQGNSQKTGRAVQKVGISQEIDRKLGSAKEGCKETQRSCHVTRKYCSSTTPIGGVGFAIM